MLDTTLYILTQQQNTGIKSHWRSTCRRFYDVDNVGPCLEYKYEYLIHEEFLKDENFSTTKPTYVFRLSGTCKRIACSYRVLSLDCVCGEPPSPLSTNLTSREEAPAAASNR